jgi:hypothetical protein
MKKNNLFIRLEKSSLGDTVLKKVVDQLKDENAITVANLTVGSYFEGLRMTGNHENGLYFYRFPDDTYYIGLNASCTFLERLAKHIDGRKTGTFNAVLKELTDNDVETDYFVSNQEVFGSSTVLFIPLFLDDIPLKIDVECKRKTIDHQMERDMIFLFHQAGYDLRNKRIPKKLSNIFNYEQ